MLVASEQSSTSHPSPGESGNWRVNHVLSTDAYSQIFSDLLRYFNRYGRRPFEYTVSEIAQGDSHVRHYHRPQFEEKLIRPCVVSVHHGLTDYDGSINFASFSRAYSAADTIICIARQQQSFLNAQGFANTCVIPHGYNSKVIVARSEPACQSDKIRLGIASRRYPRRIKGEALLLEYAKRLPTTKFSFFLVGQGRSEDAVMLHDFGFDVQVFDHLPYRVFGSFYTSIDALMVLSWHEGGPACIPEAVASGTPIISTPVGMALDYVDHKNNGLLLTRDVDQDVAMLIDFAADAALRTHISEHAMRGPGRALSWQQVVGEYEKVYRSLLSGS